MRWKDGRKLIPGEEAVGPRERAVDVIDNRHLALLRQAEIETIHRWFKPGMRILEIGGGSGYQAGIIESWGCMVSSIDVPQAERAKPRYFPVQDYDGEHVPFPDATFDLVFSSNVLEHVERLQAVLLETRRVLKPDGLAVHILPSPAWRAWTSLTHYPAMLRYLLRRRTSVGSQHGGHGSEQGRPAHSLWFSLGRALFAGPHGVYPNALSELYYFSRPRWRMQWRAGGFEPITVTTNGLFYTGYGLATGLSIRARRRLARVLGSACHIYVLRKTRSGPQSEP